MRYRLESNKAMIRMNWPRILASSVAENLIPS
jgi:hypothetical protein